MTILQVSRLLLVWCSAGNCAEFIDYVEFIYQSYPYDLLPHKSSLHLAHNLSGYGPITGTYLCIHKIEMCPSIMQSQFGTCTIYNSSNNILICILQLILFYLLPNLNTVINCTFCMQMLGRCHCRMSQPAIMQADTQSLWHEWSQTLTLWPIEKGSCTVFLCKLQWSSRF